MSAKASSRKRARCITARRKSALSTARRISPKRELCSKRASTCCRCPSFRTIATKAVLVLQVRFQPVEHLHRPAGIGADPAVVDMLDRERIEMVPPLAPLALDDHEIRAFQDLQVLHHGAAVERPESVAQLARGLRLIFQCIENIAAGRSR